MAIVTIYVLTVTGEKNHVQTPHTHFNRYNVEFDGTSDRRAITDSAITTLRYVCEFK
jgi:hypothetical protein